MSQPTPPPAQGKEFNIEGKGKPAASTGVSYKDVAGIDNVLKDIDEVMAMLLGSEQYTAAGAKAPKVGNEDCVGLILCMVEV